ncbi:MAG TPA: enolase C-terminal domain-like protein [Clostridiales bacterium]|nr:enolase C-terminal domain-like protein [Clostridiales bacterium]
MTGSALAKNKIDKIELFRYDSDVERHFSFGTWKSRQHAFIEITSGDYCGWGENVMSVNNKNISLSEWGQYFHELNGLSILEAIQYIERKLTDWGSRRCEMADMALLDLAGHIIGEPAGKLLELNWDEVKNSVPGVYVILHDDPTQVKELAKKAINEKLTTHVKLKLFGKIELDIELVRAIRDVLGEEPYIIGDVNCGYREKLADEGMHDIANQLIKLHANGLNACEDPAMLTNAQWVELQNMTGGLDLIPDYPLRLAVTAIKTILPGMGRIYNIHPGCTGSIHGAVKLGKKIKEIGGKLMIGDDSLLGPANTAWQQIAIGLGADWVEALVKPGESDGFLNSVKAQATVRMDGSAITVPKLLPGFGLEIDEDLLRHASWSNFVF